MMEVLPSSSKSISEDGELGNSSEEEIAMIAEVKNHDAPKKHNRPRKRNNSRRNSSCSIVSRVLAELKEKEGTSQNKNAVKKKSKQANLKRFDKCIKHPNDGELLIDLAADDEDLPILEEDDLIEIVEYIRNDSMRTRILIDLTEEQLTENHKQVSEDMEEGGFRKPKRCKRSKSTGEEALVDVIQNNEIGEPSSNSMVESPVVTDKDRTTAGVQESQELAIPGCSSDSTIENQETPQVDNENQDPMQIDIENTSLVEKEKRSIDPVELCKLFIGGLKGETTDETVKKYFEKWGEVLEVDIKTYPGTNRSRCFGFVTYTKMHMVDIVQKNRPHLIDGKLVFCRRSLPTKELSYPGGFMKDLFIPQLEENMKQKDLVEYFKNFGEILHCKVVTQLGRNGVRRFGFVSFSDYDSVDKILLLRCHKIKGFILRPRVCLTREQLAERDLKYYLKYFGGFSDWPMTAIEDWIKRNRDICRNSPHQMNIELLHAIASRDRSTWEGYCARSRTYSTTSSVSISVTHKDLRTIDMPRISTPMSQTTSQASCSTSATEQEKIKIEIDSDDEIDVKLNYFNKDAYLQAVKEERLPPINDLDELEAPSSSQIKTESMT